MRCLWVGWAFLTWLSAMLCTGGCLLPYWIKGTLKTNVEVYSDLGLFRRCVYPIYGQKGEVKLLHNCGHYDFGAIPHRYWQVCLVLLSSSCCILFFLTFLLFFLGFCLDLLKVKGVHRCCQFGQFFAGILALIACILYPLGWRDNTEVAQICGFDVTPFTLGRCHIGWAFVLTCAGGLLSLLATVLPFLLDQHCSGSSNRGEGNSPSPTANGDRRGSGASEAARKLAVAMAAAGSPALTGSRGGSLLNAPVSSRYSYVSYHSLPTNPNHACQI